MNRSKGGVLFKWKRINKHIQPTGLSSKLSLFLGLGCKPMKDVIMHHPDWTVQQGNRTLQAFEDRANKALDNPDIYIEATPERVSLSEFEENFDSLNVTDTLWKEDEVSITWYEYIYWKYYERSK